MIGDERDALGRWRRAADLERELDPEQDDGDPARDHAQRVERQVGNARVLAETLAQRPVEVGHGLVTEKNRRGVRGGRSPHRLWGV